MLWSWLDFNQRSFGKNIQRAIYALAHICIQREMAEGGGLHRERERESEREGYRGMEDRIKSDKMS